ncbi:MAG: hypothetical protein ACWGOX_15610, partial [Desulforhopalus sp.]
FMVDRYSQNIIFVARGLVAVMLMLAVAGAGIVQAGQACEAACPMHQPVDSRMACCSDADQDASEMGTGSVAESQRASSPCCDRGSCFQALFEAGERAAFLSLSMDVSAAAPPRLSLTQPCPLSHPKISSTPFLRPEKPRPVYKFTCTYLI